MKITVLGCGAMGKLWLAALSTEHDVQGWLRIPQHAFTVDIDKLHNRSFNRHVPANSTDKLKQSDLLLVCLKSWQVSDAVNNLLPSLSPDCAILLLHSGMGTVKELLPTPNPILIGVTTYSAYEENGRVYHTDTGITHIGPANERGKYFSYIADILHHALPDVAWHNNILNSCWMKHAANCIINPLSVIYNCKNGELREHTEQIKTLCDEITQVMLREGVHTDSQSVFDYTMNIIEHTANNYSSMLQDIRHGRHTELEYITGYLLRRARSHGIFIPENIHVYSLAKKREGDNEHFSSHLSR